jgi:DNA-binding XRE family transcriptional regulator
VCRFGSRTVTVSRLRRREASPNCASDAAPDPPGRGRCRPELTQAEFARSVGVTQGHLSSLERGEKEAGAAVLLAISQEFGKSVDWLLTGKVFVEPKKSSPR